MSEDRDSRRGPPPVEPLGDLQWARIERGVWAELDAELPEVTQQIRTRRTPWLIAMGAVAAAAAIVTVVALTRDTTPAPSRLASAPQWVVTDVGASDVTFGDARIRVAPRSAVLMNGDADQGVLVVLDRGAADFEVAPRAGRPKFVVQAGEVSVRVIGTAFRVERTGDRAKISVVHGVVEVSAGGETARIGAGETWPAQVATAPVPAPAPDVEEPAPVEMSPAEVESHPHKSTNLPPAHPDHTAAPVEPKSTDSRGDEDARHFAAAAAIEAGNPTAALAEYRRLAAAGGPWAANALYAAARLLYERHDDAAARAALTEYLHRFPRGVNAADARALLDRL